VHAGCEGYTGDGNQTGDNRQSLHVQAIRAHGTATGAVAGHAATLGLQDE